jgi:zinc transport system ATP-binding protein
LSAASIKTEPTLIDADTITVTFGAEKVLDAISLCIHAGEFIGLIGPNGAGKTTLLRILLGLQKPNSGTIQRPDKMIGYVPQRGAQHDTQVPLCVHEVVQLGAAHGDKQAIRQALADTHLTPLEHKKFSDLSGGQQQRVLIAKALASKPKLLILDEPMTGIDERSQAEFDTILRALHARGITIIMVSHDLDAVLSQVERVICLNRGLLYDGPPEHFESDKYLPQFYAAQHTLLHHKHGVTNA